MEDVKDNLSEVIAEAAHLLLPEDTSFGGRGARLEVMPGAGGMEASVFAREIFSLYTGYAASLGFSVDVTGKVLNIRSHHHLILIVRNQSFVLMCGRIPED